LILQRPASINVTGTKIGKKTKDLKQRTRLEEQEAKSERNKAACGFRLRRIRWLTPNAYNDDGFSAQETSQYSLD
jgi:hypothetical protein